MIQKGLLFLIFLSLMQHISGQPSPFIHVDQFGYHLTTEKVAILSDPQVGYNAALNYNPPATLELRDATTDLVVLSSAITQWNSGSTHDRSGDRGWWFDFSSVTSPGSYYVHDPVNSESSSVFEISDYPYGDVLKAAGRAFYYNRCNAPKPIEHAGANWTDATNFLNPLQDANCRYIHDINNAALEKNLSGGWFDAGDYNKYVTFTFSTMHDLLYAFEESPTVFGDDWNIPESGNGIPDLIDEIKWELDWLIKMTNADGSVHIKMGSQNYSENIGAPPSVNTDPRFYGTTCTSASATIASVFSHASIVLGQFPEFTSYAADLLAIAESTFDYVLPHFNNNTLETGCDNGEIISGDADRSDQEQRDIMITAAVYLFEKTGNSIYNTFFIDNYMQAKPMADNFWGPYTIPVQDAMLRYTTLPGADATVSANIINTITTHANNNYNGFYGWNDNDLYRAFMPEWSYHWGSNQAKASYGNLNNRLSDMNISNLASQRKKAKELLHYFHGVNPQGMVYLSNMYDFGAERSANEIYHTWFHHGTDWDNALTSPYGPAPGFLTGGPNKDFTVIYIIPPYGQPPQKSYKDWNAGWPENSWEITEPSIYNQAAYLRLLARVMYLARQTAWNGAADNNWGNPANWSTGYVPDNNSDITIAAAANQPVLDAQRTLDNLIIQPGAALTIPPDMALTIAGAVDNHAGNSGIIVKSDATGTGSLIVGQQGVPATVERYISAWTSAIHGWHFLASPVAGQAIQPEFVPDPPTANQDFYKWDESASTWINTKFDDGGNLIWNPDFETQFTIGKGYLAAWSANQTKSFSQMLNVADVPFSGLTRSGGNSSGWHLLGNPFSSAIKWNDGDWNMTNIAGTAKIWNESNASYTDIPANGIIPAMNGFMVQVTESSGSLTIPAASRTHDDQSWYKNSGYPKIKLLLKDLEQNTAQESTILFHPEATEGFDQDLDSRFLAGYAPQFYSVAGDEKLSTNSLPLNGIQSEIQMGFEKNNAASHEIKISALAENINVILIDQKLGLEYDLTEGGTYVFEAGNDDNVYRFRLKFGSTGFEDGRIQTVNVWVYNNDLYVKGFENPGIIEIFNLTGQLLQLHQISDSGMHSFSIKQPTGIYLVRINGSDIYQVFKIHIYRN
jgi:endoglucanase